MESRVFRGWGPQFLMMASKACVDSAWRACKGMEFHSMMEEGKMEYLWASLLEWGTKSFICRPWVHLWFGVRVLQVGEMSTRPPMILYIMVALVIVCRVFSVSNLNLATTVQVHRHCVWCCSPAKCGMPNASAPSPRSLETALIITSSPFFFLHTSQK